MYITDSDRFSHTGKVKVVICVVAILTLAYVVFVQGWQNASASRGARASEAIRLTSEQAGDMSQASSAVGTLIADAARPSSNSYPTLSGERRSAQDLLSDTATGTWYVSRIETLSARWTPAYLAAKSDIERFEHRFRTSEDRLNEYFEEQSRLTGSVNDPSLVAELRHRDSEEREAYARWMEEGGKLLDRALAIGRELDDMDVVIRKQQLTANMLSQYTRASSIPGSAQSLHRALGEFRMQSDELARDLSIHVFN